MNSILHHCTYVYVCVKCMYVCAWFGHVMALVMVFLKNALMCIKKVKLINHDCLPILMLLYIMLYIVLAYLMLYIVNAYLMLFAALSNAVCLNNAALLQMISIFMFCLGLLTHSLSMSCINLHHAQSF